MIRDNNVSRPVQNQPSTALRPHNPPAQNLEGRDPPTLPGLTPLATDTCIYIYNIYNIYILYNIYIYIYYY